ncbi:hypothetical protein LJC22_02980 [Desulfosarcina sp. OttesenSCG-928-G10]|nr:hypothetical protein [Desulfosarcina sp. OttesenSCG-928-G10]MDL2321945.1 hypothetical protein [Desulfosarcina sp. OttesenSCG-928-B08]
MTVVLLSGQGAAEPYSAGEYEAFPAFQSATVPPLVMLVVARDHSLFSSAYDDASDLDGDGIPDTRFNPAIVYYGYFDPHKSYSYRNRRFEPAGPAPDKKGHGRWSGNFLNYLAMSRMDTVRKALYGGMRSTDTDTETVLERAHIPQDAHSWGKEYTSIAVDGYAISDYTPLGQPEAGKRHLFASTSHCAGGDPLLLILTNRSERIWEWVARGKPVAGDQIGIGNAAAPVSWDHKLVVRVKVADPEAGLEANCKLYPGGAYKPVGLLQRYGENGGMYVGLLTGSYAKNMSGGVVRKNVGNIADEINPETGRIKTSPVGIIQTLNRLRIDGFDERIHAYKGGAVYTRPMAEGEFPDWGNPVAEMMYEAVRYFSCPDKGATADYDYGAGASADKTLGLPRAGTWTDPFIQNGVSLHCAQPIMLVISGTSPSHDSDQVPGSAFAAAGWSSAKALGAGNLTVSGELDRMDAGMAGKMYAVGQSGNLDDGACTPKTVSHLSHIRGLCPEAPTQKGSYYAGAVARFGRNTDLRTDLPGDQQLSTYVMALSSPLPAIEIPVAGHTIRLTPFARTLMDADGTMKARGFTPTCAVTGFFAEERSPGKGRFKVSFDALEQGGDHGMDMLVTYHYQVVGETVKITVENASPAAKDVIHAGYIISGTTHDGIFLEVSNTNEENGESSRGPTFLYELDTPPDVSSPGRPAGNITPLPATSHTRTFSPGGDPSVQTLNNPLWYAARWGGVADGEDWDKDNDGTPDHYFDALSPLVLEPRFNTIFQHISKNAATGTASSVMSAGGSGESTLLQAWFRPSVVTEAGTLSWLGYLQSLWVDGWGNIREDSNGNGKLDPVNTMESSLAGNADKIIEYTFEDGETRIRRYTRHFRYHPKNQHHDECVLAHLGAGSCDTTYETVGFDEIRPIFEVGEKLHQRTAESRKIFTFVDENWTRAQGPSGKHPGQVANPFDDDPFDSAGEVIAFHPDNLDAIRPFLGLQDSGTGSYLDTGSSTDEKNRARTLIQYVRGIDFPTTRSRTLDGKVWKLGDIINSTPVSVSGHSEGYHLLYGDESFQHYVDARKNRETVVYAGANDGMLHAFTAGRHNPSTGSYTRPSGTSSASSDALGDELWAYIPQALLPHLKFLADPDYGHSFYVDLKPRVFDAQINGEWKTLLLVGLGMGGKAISVTENGYTRMFRPTYTCLDVTDPRNPRLLWERSYDNLGMSASIPAIVVTGKKRADGAWSGGTWRAVFGSGPTGYDGQSGQNGYVFVVDVATGEPCKNEENDWLLDTKAATAVMNSPSAFDHKLDYTVDAVYIGAARGAAEKGAVFKINTHGADDPHAWSLSTLFQTDGPVTAPITLSTDRSDQVWLFFGTGRYLSLADKVDDSPQYFFGIKDPFYCKGNGQGAASRTDSEVKMGDLYNATGKQVTAHDISVWNDLVQAAGDKKGWYYALASGSPSARVISKASIFGGMVVFPSYLPAGDVCGFGGETYFYGLYYETGTAFHQPAVEGSLSPDNTVSTRLYGGIGAPPPSAGFCVGLGPGATAFLQLSTGQILKIDVETAFPMKSAITGWRDKSR